MLRRRGRGRTSQPASRRASQARGSLRGLGRLKKSSGTDDPTLFKLLNTMLTMLYRGGRLDLLQALRDGLLTPLEVWTRYRVGELERLPTPDTMRGLRGALDGWVATAEASRWHRQARTYAVRAALRLARQDATVQDPPALLRSYAWGAKGPTMFNRTRAAMLAFLRDTLGRSHPLYQQCRDVRPRKEAKRAGSPLTVAEVTALARSSNLPTPTSCGRWRSPVWDPAKCGAAGTCSRTGCTLRGPSGPGGCATCPSCAPSGIRRAATKRSAPRSMRRAAGALSL